MKLIFRLLTYKEKLSLTVLFVFNIIAACLEIIGIGMIPLIITFIVDPTSIKHIPVISIIFEDILIFTTISFSNFLFYSSLIIISVFLIKNLFLFLLILFETKITAQFKITYGLKLFKFYITRPLKFHLDNEQSKLIRNLQLEATKAASLVFLYMTVFKELLFLFLVIVILLYTNLLVTSVVFAVLSLSALFYYLLFKKRLNIYGVQNLSFKTEKVKLINFSLTSIKDIKTFLSEFWISKQFSKATHALENNIRKSQIIQKTTKLYLELIGIVVIMIISFFLLSEKSFEKNLPSLSLFIIAIIKLTPSINNILLNLSNIKFTMPSLKAIVEIIQKYNLKPVNLKKKTINKKEKKIQKIQLQNISYKINSKKKYLFKNLNLEFYSNNIYGIIGKSGSGKSTLLNIVSSLIKPSNGLIKIDGKKLDAKNMNYLNNIGYVGQDSKLIYGTLKQNIIFGNTKKETNEISLKKLIKDVGLSDFYRKLDNGFDTLIENDGKKISGGERQRIIICRSFYKNCSLLMLDEPTTGLDKFNEENILSRIKNLKKDKIILMSFHNLKHKKYCDYLVKINYNNKVELIKN